MAIDAVSAGLVAKCPKCEQAFTVPEGLNVLSRSQKSKGRARTAVGILGIALILVSTLATLQFLNPRKRTDPKAESELLSLKTEVESLNAKLEATQKSLSSEAVAKEELKKKFDRVNSLNEKFGETFRVFAMKYVTLLAASSDYGDALQILGQVQELFPNDATLTGLRNEIQKAKDSHQAKANQARQNLKTLKEIETDQLSFVSKPVIVQGKIELDSYYNFGYGDAQETHFSFNVTDSSGSGYVYMLKRDAAGIRKQLLDAGGSLRGVFKIEIRKERFQKGSRVFAELLDAGPPLD